MSELPLDVTNARDLAGCVIRRGAQGTGCGQMYETIPKFVRRDCDER